MVTEKKYPIRLPWILKPLQLSLLLVALSLFIYWTGLERHLTGPVLGWLIALVIIVPLVLSVCARAAFHYSLEDQVFSVREGIFSVRERTMPYGVIQNLVIDQDVFDKMFGLATVIIEHASQGGGDAAPPSWFRVLLLMGRYQRARVGSAMITGKRATPSLGFSSSFPYSANMVVIPGLSEEDAEALKKMFLRKMTRDPP